MATEVWKPVAGNAMYEVSNLGRVRSWCDNKWGCRSAPRLLKSWASGRYGHRAVTIAGLARWRVHTLVLETFVGPCPPGQECRHLNGVAWDNRLSNLTWGTSTQNKQDRRDHGTCNTGIRNPMAKLTPAIVRRIRTAYAKLKPHQRGGIKDLAQRYGISRSAVQQIVYGHNWKGV